MRCFWFALALIFAGKEASAAVTRLLEVDPLTPPNQALPPLLHFMRGHFSLAVTGVRRWYEADPDHPAAVFLCGSFLARNGNLDEADVAFDRLARTQQTVISRLGLFLRHALAGNKTNALQAVTPALTKAARWDGQYSWEMAAGYALIEEIDEALEWLENAPAHGFINYPFLSQYDPLLENHPPGETVQGR